MKCLRCGMCCVAYDVILPDGMYKPNGQQCKFLVWEGNQASCSIHGKTVKLEGYKYRWSETPCGRHGQIEKNKTCPCRMGAYLRKKHEDGRKWIRP